MKFKEWLWDHISPKQKKSMADMLSQSSYDNIRFFEYFLSIKSGKFVEVMSGKIINSIHSYLENSKKISDDDFLKIQFFVGEKSLNVFLADLEGKNRIRISMPESISAKEELIAHGT